MTINTPMIEQHFTDAAIAEAKQHYSRNVVLKSYPKMFFRILALRQKYGKDLSFYIRNTKDEFSLYSQIDTLYVSEESSDEILKSLTFDDKLKLILNGIDHLPSCKCKMRELKAQL